MNAPKPIMIKPPMWFRLLRILPADNDTTLFSTTPRIENTIVNPPTKNNVFRKILSLFDTMFMVPLFLCNSDNVVPEMYARNAGIIGSMQGARKDPSPANAAIPTVSSTT